MKTFPFLLILLCITVILVPVSGIGITEEERQENLHKLYEQTISNYMNQYNNNDFSNLVSLGDPEIYKKYLQGLTIVIDPKAKNPHYVGNKIVLLSEPDPNNHDDQVSLFHEMNHAVENAQYYIFGIGNPFISNAWTHRNTDYIEN